MGKKDSKSNWLVESRFESVTGNLRNFKFRPFPGCMHCKKSVREKCQDRETKNARRWHW